MKRYLSIIAIFFCLAAASAQSAMLTGTWRLDLPGAWQLPSVELPGETDGEWVYFDHYGDRETYTYFDPDYNGLEPFEYLSRYFSYSIKGRVHVTNYPRNLDVVITDDYWFPYDYDEGYYQTVKYRRDGSYTWYNTTWGDSGGPTHRGQRPTLTLLSLDDPTSDPDGGSGAGGQPSPVPLPASALLLAGALGCCGLLPLRRRRSSDKTS